jgi:ABC-type uncharacterized transport system fused permease/ATPase subunit
MNLESDREEIANSGLVPQLGMMLRALWAAPVRNVLFLLSGALFLVIAVTAYGQIRLNSWNQPSMMRYRAATLRSSWINWVSLA